MQEKTITFGDAVITLKRLTVGGRNDLLEMTERFMPELEAGAKASMILRYNRRHHLISLAAYTKTMTGVPLDLPHPSDSEKTFERKLKQFFDLDEELVNIWMDGVAEISQPLADRATLPPEMQKDTERDDPN